MEATIRSELSLESLQREKPQSINMRGGKNTKEEVKETKHDNNTVNNTARYQSFLDCRTRKETVGSG